MESNEKQFRIIDWLKSKICVYAGNSPHLLVPQTVEQIGGGGPKNI